MFSTFVSVPQMSHKICDRIFAGKTSQVSSAQFTFRLLSRVSICVTLLFERILIPLKLPLDILTYPSI